jgi:conjugal transfer pilus assembly protein TraU
MSSLLSRFARYAHRGVLSLGLVLAGCGATVPVHAMSWLDVLQVAQGVSRPNAPPFSPNDAPKPPVIDPEANKGIDGRGQSSYTCPSPSLADLLVAGRSNAFVEIQLGGICVNCRMVCPIVGRVPTAGFVVKFWGGTHLVEVVRTRGCLPTLFGWEMPAPPFLEPPARSSGGEDGFYHVHALPNPAMLLIKDALEGLFCHRPSLFEFIPLLSELDATWNPSTGVSEGGKTNELDMPSAWADIISGDFPHLAKRAVWRASVTASAAASLVESMACVGECMILAAGGGPVDNPALVNCSGCNGLVAPYKGSVSGVGGRRAAELIAHRFVALAMNGRDWESTISSDAYCNDGFRRPAAEFAKSEFRLQSLFPAREGTMRQLGAPHAVVVGEHGKQGHFREQDYIFQLWKRRECCRTFTGPCDPVPSGPSAS